MKQVCKNICNHVDTNQTACFWEIVELTFVLTIAVQTILMQLKEKHSIEIFKQRHITLDIL